MGLLATILRSLPIGGGAPPAVSSGTHPFLRGLPDGEVGRSIAAPYIQSPWVMRAIKHIAEPISNAPLLFKTPTATGDKPYNNPDLASFWKFPAQGPEGPISYSQAMQAFATLLKLDGHFYQVLDDTWLVGTNTPARLRGRFLIVRADRMKPIFDSPAKGRVKGWIFRDASGRDWPLLPEQVQHPKLFNPYDPVAGAGEYEGVKLATEGDNFAAQFVRALMEANGDRGPIISPKDGTTVFSDAQVKQMQAALDEKRRMNIAGKFKTLFLSGNVDVADPHVSSTDKDFVTQRIENRKEIFVGLGVPASFAEPRAKYSIGQESDNYRLLVDTCVPLANLICGMAIDPLAMRLVGMSGQGLDTLVAQCDFSKHPSMQEAVLQKIDQAATLFSFGMPPQKISDYLGLGLPRWDGDDQGLVAINLQTLKDAIAEPPQEQQTQPNPNDPPQGDDKADPHDKALQLFRQPLPGSLTHLLSLPVASVQTVVTLTADDEENRRSKLWAKYMQKRIPAEKRVKKIASKHIMQARVAVLSKLHTRAVSKAEDGGDDADDRTPNDILEGIDIDAFTAALVNDLNKAARTNAQEFGIDTRADLGTGADNAWTMPPKELAHALDARKNLIKDCAQNIFDDIKDALQEGFEAGDTTAELADRVRAACNEMSKTRAETIAQTETGAAYGAGSQAGAESVGAKSKQWLSARDAKVRPSHKQADGQNVHVEGYFRVGGFNALHPCADTLPANESCNCRCVVTYSMDPVPGS